jgi:hypothetical protein
METGDALIPLLFHVVQQTGTALFVVLFHVLFFVEGLKLLNVILGRMVVVGGKICSIFVVLISKWISV